MTSFTTDSIIIIHTKARSYKHWRYSYKTPHAKKVELESRLGVLPRQQKFKKHCFVAIFGLVIFVSYVELLYRLASDLALKTKYYSTLFSIGNLSEMAFFFKKPGQFLFCFDHAVAWDSSRTGPANIPHATVGSLLKIILPRWQKFSIKFYFRFFVRSLIACFDT
jgi:hypothetical protein